MKIRILLAAFTAAAINASAQVTPVLPETNVVTSYDQRILRWRSGGDATVETHYRTAAGTPQDLTGATAVLFKYKGAEQWATNWWAVTGAVYSATGGITRIPWTTANERGFNSYEWEETVSSPTAVMLRQFGTLYVDDGVTSHGGSQTDVGLTTIDWLGLINLHEESAPWSTAAIFTAYVAADAAMSNALVSMFSISTNGLQTITSTNGSILVTTAGTNVDLAIYVAPVLTSFTGGATYYKGQVVTNPALTWVVNKTLTGRTLSSDLTYDLGAGGSGTYTDTGRNLDKDTAIKDYTFVGTDGTTSITGTTSYSFTNYKYVGPLNHTPALNSDILAFTASTQSKGASGTTTNLYSQGILICYPASLGYCNIFNLGGISVSSNTWPVATQSVTNAHGYAESFIIYSTTNLLTAGSMSYDIH